MRLAQRRLRRPRPDDVRRRPTTASRRSSRRSTPARCSSTSACCRRRRRRTAARRPARRSARRRRAGPAATVQIYLNLAGRDPAGGGLQQVAAADEAATVAAIEAAFLALDGPQRLDRRRRRPRAGRSSTAPSPRPRRAAIPNGAAQHRRHGPPDPHRRPRRVLRAAVPVRRGDARHADRPLGVLRPARLRARTSQDLDANTNMRATFLAGGDGDRPRRRARRAQHRPRADGGVPARRPGAAAQPGRRAARPARPRPQLHAAVNHRAQRLPRPARPDHDARSTACTRPSAGPPQLATMFDEEAAALPGRTLLLAAGDNVGASPPNSALLEDMPAIDVENAWGLDATSLRQPRVRLRHRAPARAPGARRLPVPLGQHRRGGDRRGARLAGRSAVFRRQRRARRRDRRHRPDDARAGACRRDRGPAVPRRGRAHPQRSRSGCATAASRCRSSSSTRAPCSAPTRVDGQPAEPWQGPIDRHRRGAAGHDDRPRDRRPHAPHRQHRRRPHPRRRGLQRRRELLGRAAAGQGPATSRGRARRRASPRTSASRRGPTSRRSSTRPTPRRRALRNRGDRHAGGRHPARSDAAERVGDGQPGRRRDARHATRASTRR